MEMTLTILMALGIFVGIPVVIGLAVAGAYVVVDRRNRAVVGFATGTRAYTRAYHGETTHGKINAR